MSLYISNQTSLLQLIQHKENIFVIFNNAFVFLLQNRKSIIKWHLIEELLTSLYETLNENHLSFHFNHWNNLFNVSITFSSNKHKELQFLPYNSNILHYTTNNEERMERFFPRYTRTNRVKSC